MMKIHLIVTSSMPLQVDVKCGICKASIHEYALNYFGGKQEDQTCIDCLKNDGQLDSFKSFPSGGMPTTLVAHWIPSHLIGRDSACSDLSKIPSFRSHYFRLPNPGEQFTAMEEMMQQFRILLNSQQQCYKEGCRQSQINYGFKTDNLRRLFVKSMYSV